ncbi:aurora kinase A- and ninein-interacting protein [Lampetra fluviatilis]
MPAKRGKRRGGCGPFAAPSQDGDCGVWIDTAQRRRKRPPSPQWPLDPRAGEPVPRPGARQTRISAFFITSSGGGAGEPESSHEDGDGAWRAPSCSSAGRWNDGNSDGGASDKISSVREFGGRSYSSFSNDRSRRPLPGDGDGDHACPVAESRSEFVNASDPAAVPVRTEPHRREGNATGDVNGSSSRPGSFDANEDSNGFSPLKARSASHPHLSSENFQKQRKVVSRPFGPCMAPDRPDITATDTFSDSENAFSDSENTFSGDGGSDRTEPARDASWEDSECGSAALFTQDTQGARVIAHRRVRRGHGSPQTFHSRERARGSVLEVLDENVTSDCDVEESDLTSSLRSKDKRRRIADPESQSQSGAMFTTDSQGNRVIHHGCFVEY